MDARPKARGGLGAGLVLAAGAALAAALMVLLRRLPVGVSYSDSYMYLDAAHRILSGEAPNLDFFSPMGPLPAYAYAAAARLVPAVQPVLAAQLSIALLAGLALWPVVRHARLRRAALGAALLFVLLAVSPYNWGDFKGFAVLGEADGYGLYNRQAGLLLFALTACAWLAPPLGVQRTAASLLLAALFFTKITAFPLGAAICAWGLLRRRAAPRSYLLLLAPTALAAAGAQLAGGALLAYLADMARIGQTGGLFYAAQRLKHEAATAAPILALLLLILGMQAVRDARRLGRARAAVRSPWRLALRLARSRTAGWALLCAGALMVESQNTGSQAFAFVAPAALAVAPRRLGGATGALGPGLRLGLGVAPAVLAAAYLAASWASFARMAPALVPLDAPALERLGVSARRGDLDAARTILAEVKGDPSLLSGPGRARLDRLISDQKGELLFLLEIDDAAVALDRWRAGAPLARPTVAALDFVDPFGFLAGAAPLRGADIVYDPERTIPPAAEPALNAAWARADALLARRCFGVDAVVALAAPALRGRRAIALDPCWDLYVKPGR